MIGAWASGGEEIRGTLPRLFLLRQSGAVIAMYRIRFAALIESRIHSVRGNRVLLDADLAALNEVDQLPELDDLRQEARAAGHGVVDDDVMVAVWAIGEAPLLLLELALDLLALVLGHLGRVLADAQRHEPPVRVLDDVEVVLGAIGGRELARAAVLRAALVGRQRRVTAAAGGAQDVTVASGNAQEVHVELVGLSTHVDRRGLAGALAGERHGDEDAGRRPLGMPWRTQSGTGSRVQRVFAG